LSAYGQLFGPIRTTEPVARWARRWSGPFNSPARRSSSSPRRRTPRQDATGRRHESASPRCGHISVRPGCGSQTDSNSFIRRPLPRDRRFALNAIDMRVTSNASPGGAGGTYNRTQGTYISRWPERCHFSHIQHDQTKSVEITLIWWICRRIPVHIL